MLVQEIDDDEWLLRRIPPWHSPHEDQALSLDGEIVLRPPSAAFSLDPGETGLSFHLEGSLRAAGEQLTYGCPEGVPGWAVTRISARAIRQLGLQLVRDERPHHVLVLGLAQLKGNPLRRLQREIARRSEYIVLPRVS